MRSHILTVFGGHGGAGSAAFARNGIRRRSVGGNGGDGGNVVLHFSHDPLMVFKFSHKVCAGSGGNGGKEGMNGARGIDATIVYPRDTLVYETAVDGSGRRVANFTGGEILVRGGKGGLGNSILGRGMSTKGVDGGTKTYRVEPFVKLDVALLGLPNAGKSTLFRALTGKNAAISTIPFSTESLQMAEALVGKKKLLIGDFPGLLSFQDLTRQSMRALLDECKKVVVLVDSSRPQTLSYVNFVREMLKDTQKCHIVLTKTDLVGIGSYSANSYNYAISCQSGEGLLAFVESII